MLQCNMCRTETTNRMCTQFARVSSMYDRNISPLIIKGKYMCRVQLMAEAFLMIFFPFVHINGHL